MNTIDSTIKTSPRLSADRACIKPWSYRYELLDGLRGIAALFVVLLHLGYSSVGHFAVMAFFVISGYCITASAESSRERNLRFSEFMWRRARRIYPPYWCALLFFAFTRAVKSFMGERNDLSHSVVEWIQNATLTQWLSMLIHPQAWAAENPVLFVGAFWSLNYEEQFYLVMGLILILAARKGIPMVVPILTLLAAGLAFNWIHPGQWMCGMFLEYWTHFALGSLLFLVLCKYTNIYVRVVFLAALVAMGAVLACRLLPWTAHYVDDQRAFVELMVLVSLTLCLFIARPFSDALTRSTLWRPVSALGTISYSLYLIHQFNVHLVQTVARRLVPAGAPGLLLGVVTVALCILLASVFWYFCERPFVSRARSWNRLPEPMGD